MDEGESKTCDNCKRDIPAVNFTTHTVFCARNIRVCPVCKEPVPQAELQEHHEKMHKLLPCKECGEDVCGTDLEDHIRDSCAHTMQSCKFCLLELRRSSMPAHERFCGARTEHCADCGEWVMHKYRQLHLDSNHGFVRLDDDPVPSNKDDKATNAPKPLNLTKPSKSSEAIKAPKVSQSTDVLTKNTNVTRPVTDIRYFSPKSNLENSDINTPSASISESNSSTSAQLGFSRREASTAANPNRPQTGGGGRADRVTVPSDVASAVGVEAGSSSDVAAGSSSDVAAGSSSDVAAGSSSALNGAVPRLKRTNDQPQVNAAGEAADKVKKNLWSSRGATKKRPAPKPPASVDPRPLASALQRQQDEELQRLQKTAYNLSVGLPPVLSPAAKLDKLRKLDALQNPVADDQEYKNRSHRSRTWINTQKASAGHVLGSSSKEGSTSNNLKVSRWNGSESISPENVQDGREVRRNDFKDLKPMTPEEFIDRFNELQLRNPDGERLRSDRFSQIKSSLRELRRGLNEVTAPYNTNANSEPYQSELDSPEDSPVRLPCEFCAALVPLDDLVQHQTGCRPDLAQYRPDPAQFRSDLEQTRPEPAESQREPGVYIPCEFCTQPQPVYLLSEHQERCGRESNMLFPD